ncbi:fimbrial chaperone [Escherichia marmotae]|uniref:fimbrial chaperone n=1 Tax=Escherichia marmotae TaxID=1499973 RepID=UPI003D978BEC
MLNYNKTIAAIVVGATLTAFSPITQADIVINGTRIIYKESDKKITARLENKGSRPLLVQSWLDTGDDNVDPALIKVPFNATPPVSRIDPKKGQTVTITYTGTQALPKDRESVYWFNVLEVPPKMQAKEAENKNVLQLAFRTRIKLFYRPDGLAGEHFKVPEQLTWRWNGNKIKVTNPTPYYVSFSSVDVQSGNKKYTVDATMVAPKSDAEFTVQGLNTSPGGAKLHYSAISDYGSEIKGEANM